MALCLWSFNTWPVYGRVTQHVWIQTGPQWEGQWYGLQAAAWPRRANGAQAYFHGHTDDNWEQCFEFWIKKKKITENCFFLVFCRPTEGREILYMAAVSTKASSDPSVLLCQSGDIFEAQTARLGNAGNSGLG